VQEVCSSSQKNSTIQPSLTSRKCDFKPFGPLEMWESQWAQHNMIIHDHLVLLHTNHDCSEATWVSVRTPSSQPWERTANNSEQEQAPHGASQSVYSPDHGFPTCCSNVHHTQRGSILHQNLSCLIVSPQRNEWPAADLYNYPKPRRAPENFLH
jgi:hypothetical protein